MISMETFLFGLMIISALTSLVTEGVKKLLAERNITYYANTLVAIVSVVLSVAISIGYIVLAGMTFTSQTVVYTVALVVLSWLCAMVGYDKVIQAISQFKTTSEESDRNE